MQLDFLNGMFVLMLSTFIGLMVIQRVSRLLHTPLLSLQWMSDPKTARRGVFAGVGGMSLAVIGTMLHPQIVNFNWIALALVLGVVAGIPLSRVALTAVPQRTALSHAFGGLAAGLV